MTDEQKAAFIQSQAACAIAEIAAMQAENQVRLSRGEAQAYDEEAFMSVQRTYVISHNAVIEFMRS